MLLHPPGRDPNDPSATVVANPKEDLSCRNLNLMGYNFPTPYMQDNLKGGTFFTTSTTSVNTERDIYDDSDSSVPGQAYTTNHKTLMTNKLQTSFKPLRPRFYLVPDVVAPPTAAQKKRKAFASKARAVGSEFLQMNAIILGFGSPEKVAENAAPVWWDERRIRYTVTPQFVSDSMPRVADLRKRLKMPVGFGDGLTDETYTEWIVSKTRRFFLILEKLGIPEQIFGIIDDSWDDNDLPIPREGVGRLCLSATPNKTLDRRFWETQYEFLLRGVSKDAHIDYESYETVPVEPIEKISVSSFGGPGGFGGAYTVEKVAPPNGRWTKTFYTRVTIPLKDDHDPTAPTPSTNHISRSEFMRYVRDLKQKPIDHPNIIHLFASYTSLQNSQRAGYLLYAPYTPSQSLESYIRSPSYLYNSLSIHERRVLVFNWITSLSSAVAYLHAREIRHGNIQPKNIVVIGGGKKVLLADAGIDGSPPLPGTRISAVRAQIHTEMFEYGAPEDYPSTSARSRFFSISDESTASGSSNSGDSVRSFSIHRIRRNSLTNVPPAADLLNPEYDVRPSTSGTDAFSMAQTMSSGTTTTTVLTTESPMRYKSDVFSLGCLIVDILSFVCKKKISSFRSHRRAATTALRPVLSTTTFAHAESPTGDSSDSSNYEPTMSWLSPASIPSTACTFETDSRPATPDPSMLAPPPHLTPSSRRKKNDGSFHSNLGSVNSWINLLAESGDGAEDTHRIVVQNVSHLVRSMIRERPIDRPEAEDVVGRLTEIASELRAVMEEMKSKK